MYVNRIYQVYMSTFQVFLIVYRAVGKEYMEHCPSFTAVSLPLEPSFRLVIAVANCSPYAIKTQVSILALKTVLSVAFNPSMHSTKAKSSQSKQGY